VVRREQPIFNTPPAVVALLGLMVGIHMARSLLSEDADDWLIFALAFIPARFTSSGADMPGYPWSLPVSFVSHLFLHGNVVHLLVNGAWLLAVGTPVARRLGAPRFFAMFFGSGIAGAGLFWAFHIGALLPMVGASGAVSGLMAALFPLIFAVRDDHSRWLLREHTEAMPRLTALGLWQDGRALTSIAAWVGVNFLVALGVGGFAPEGGVAWEAHLGGFVAGLVLFFLLDRGPRLDQLPGEPTDI
jgi:membrane associated rhomboid family serine protease